MDAIELELPDEALVSNFVKSFSHVEDYDICLPSLMQVVVQVTYESSQLCFT